MSKTVYINESQVPTLLEASGEVTFYKFFTKTKNFLNKLLDNPFTAYVDDLLKNHGVTKEELLDRMLERGIIKKKEKIDEPYDSGGKKVSMHTLQYKIPKKGFEDKMHRLYDFMLTLMGNKMMGKTIYITEDGLNLMLGTAYLNEEEGIGGAGATNTAGINVGGAIGQQKNHIDVPFGVQRRDIYKPKSRKTKKNEVDMSDSLRRHDGKCGSVSIPKHKA